MFFSFFTHIQLQNMIYCLRLLTQRTINFINYTFPLYTCSVIVVVYLLWQFVIFCMLSAKLHVFKDVPAAQTWRQKTSKSDILIFSFFNHNCKKYFLSVCVQNIWNILIQSIFISLQNVEKQLKVLWEKCTVYIDKYRIDQLFCLACESACRFPWHPWQRPCFHLEFTEAWTLHMQTDALTLILLVD